MNIRFGVALSLALIASLVSVHTQQTTQARTTAQQRDLSVAVTLFATDDDRPDAERLLQRVIKTVPVTTNDGATARYYLGRLYHRNYYMLNYRKGLDQAVERYKEVHDTSLGRDRRGAWYAEARFYKSLVYLQQGKWKDVYESVDHIDPLLDATTDIDYLVWSINKRPINRRVPTAALREEYLKVLQRNKIVMTRRDGLDLKTTNAVIDDLQRLLERSPNLRTVASPK